MAAAKLHGYAWWRSIGAPQRICAPMVDQSEEAFRQLCREFGTTLAYTPMLHSRMMTEADDYKATFFSTSAADRPVIAQFCGNDPDTLLRAAKMVEDEVDAVDINLGCPQGIARRGHYGSFLLEETDLLVRMVTALHQGLKVPVTCKVRILPTWDATLRLVKALEAAGASLLTVHGRTRTNMKQSITAVDWQIIKRIKENVSIPVVANGGIGCVEDVEKCLAFTGCDAVMSSEALLENPGLFSDNIPTSGPLYEAARAAGKAPARCNQIDLALRYLDIAEGLGTDWGQVRAHIFKMAFGLWRTLPSVRDAFTTTVTDISGARRVLHELSRRYQQEIVPQIYRQTGSSAADGAGALAEAPAVEYKAECNSALEGLFAQWREVRAAHPHLGWAKPTYLIDPAVAGSWYMRYRPEAYCGAKSPDAAADGSFAIHIGEEQEAASLPLAERLLRYKAARDSTARPVDTAADGGCGCTDGGDAADSNQPTLSGLFGNEEE